MTACCCRLTRPETAGAERSAARRRFHGGSVSQRGDLVNVRGLYPGGQIRRRHFAPIRVFAHHAYAATRASPVRR